MNQIEGSDDLLDLVGLQMTDQMPIECQIRQLRLFAEGLLNPILTDRSDPLGMNGADVSPC